MTKKEFVKKREHWRKRLSNYYETNGLAKQG